jgi:hypothetical protein
MAVDAHPSRKPGLPRKPPATSTTAGTINKMPAKGGSSGQANVNYGACHEVNVKPSHKSERHYDFNEGVSMGSSSEGRAPRPGKEQPQEGPKKGQRASRPGDEKGNDEPG